jgi:hypothetical protein
MMRIVAKSRHFVLLLLLLLEPLLASAQPSGPYFITEHNWTFQIGTGRYGLTEWRYAYSSDPSGKRSRTTLVFGTPRFVMETRFARAIEVLLVLGVATMLVLIRKKGGLEPNEPN